MNTKSVLRIILRILSFRACLFFLLQFLFIYNTVSQAQWVQTNGPSEGYVQMLAVSGVNLFAGTYSTGVWKRPLSEFTDVTEEVNNMPQGFTLSQNFPNPFNPSTTIKFSLPKATHVTLSIYNSLGQEVSKLISKDMNAGVYTTEWNATSFASGVYYYRIVASGFVQTKKLLLLK